MSYNALNPPYHQQQQPQQQQQQHGFPAQQNPFPQSGFPFPTQLDPRTVFTPQQPAVSSSGQPIGNDPFNSLAASVIQQQGSNYLERGQEFVKSRMGFINSSSLHYHFNVDAEYGEMTMACQHDSLYELRVQGCVTLHALTSSPNTLAPLVTCRCSAEEALHALDTFSEALDV